MKNKSLRILSMLLGASLIIAALLSLAGFLTPGRIDPGRAKQGSHAEASFQANNTYTVIEQELIDYQEAVGTIQSKSKIRISAQINGQIEAVLVKSGQTVKAGQLLVRIDKEAALAGLRQADESLKAAKAAGRQALHNLEGAKALLLKSKTNYERMKEFHRKEVITDQKMEAVQAEYDNSVAVVEQARQHLQGSAANVKAAEQEVRSAEIRMSYTEVKATEDGIISERLVEPGDLAGAGKPLLIFYNPERLRLEASITENLIGKVSIGSKLTVVVDALKKELTGEVTEIVPSADPGSRTFLIKVTLPVLKDLYPGMFGRLFLPKGVKKVFLAPKSSIYRVGQLEMVKVRVGTSWHDRYVRTGKIYDRTKVEILSGLRPGDVVAVRE